MSITHLMPLDGNTKSWSDFSTSMCGKTYRQLSEDTEAHVTAKPLDATCVPCLRADDQQVNHLMCLFRTACGITEPDDTNRHDMMFADPDKVNCSDCINTPVFDRIVEYFKDLRNRG